MTGLLFPFYRNRIEYRLDEPKRKKNFHFGFNVEPSIERIQIEDPRTFEESLSPRSGVQKSLVSILSQKLLMKAS